MKLRKDQRKPARQREKQLEGEVKATDILQMDPASCTSQGQTLSQPGSSRSFHLGRGRGEWELKVTMC